MVLLGGIPRSHKDSRNTRPFRALPKNPRPSSSPETEARISFEADPFLLTLEQLCHRLGADRSYVFRYFANKRYRITHQWQKGEAAVAPALSFADSITIPDEIHPSLHRGETVRTAVHAWPLTALTGAPAQDSSTRNRSLIVTPLHPRDEVIGGLGVESPGGTFHERGPTVSLLTTVSLTIGKALYRIGNRKPVPLPREAPDRRENR